MSNYPAWWNTTITVFNKYEDPATRRITWYKTVVHNCFWKDTGNKIIVGETTLDTNATICRIPSNSSFIENYQWNEAPDKAQYFTLNSGDILIKGNVSDDIDEYVSGKRASDILAKYHKLQGCMVIEKWSISDYPGVGIPHYYVKGV